MDQESEQESGDSQSPPPTHSSELFEESGDLQFPSAQHDIGDQTGLSYRSPSFGKDGLMSRTRDYLGVTPMLYSTDEFNQRFLSSSGDAMTSAAEKYAISVSGGLAASGQIGLIGPIIGFGPYAGFSITGGYTARGETFVQVQGSAGGGIGSFYSFGTTEPITAHGRLEEGLSTSDRLEFNAGLGVRSASVSVNKDLEVTTTASGLLSPKLSLGQTEGLGVAYVHSFTYTVINPEIDLKQAWDNFSLSVGRDIHEVEVQLYQWSRMTAP